MRQQQLQSNDTPAGGYPTPVDVIVVQKKTALERYAAEFKSDSGRSYFLRDGDTDQTLQKAHDQHCQTLDSLLTYLTRMRVSFTLRTLDDLSAEKSSELSYFQAGKQTGLESRLNLVISLGGDGTLLRTSHFVGGNIRLLGINSVPQHSVGHLCPLKPNTLEDGLNAVLDGTSKPKTVRRLVARTSNGMHLPYALNDIFFGHQHPASASRYSLHIEGHHPRSEKQLSSGVWVATPAGSTAAIRSYGLDVLDPTSHSFLLAVREPYNSAAHHLKLTKLVLDGDNEHINLFSRMRHGIVCVDGLLTTGVLGFGETLEIDLGTEGALKLFL